MVALSICEMCIPLKACFIEIGQHSSLWLERESKVILKKPAFSSKNTVDAELTLNKIKTTKNPLETCAGRGSQDRKKDCCVCSGVFPSMDEKRKI